VVIRSSTSQFPRSQLAPHRPHPRGRRRPAHRRSRGKSGARFDRREHFRCGRPPSRQPAGSRWRPSSILADSFGRPTDGVEFGLPIAPRNAGHRGSGPATAFPMLRDQRPSRDGRDRRGRHSRDGRPSRLLHPCPRAPIADHAGRITYAASPLRPIDPTEGLLASQGDFPPLRHPRREPQRLVSRRSAPRRRLDHEACRAAPGASGGRGPRGTVNASCSRGLPR
jgi:hypothetical protein